MQKEKVTITGINARMFFCGYSHKFAFPLIRIFFVLFACCAPLLSFAQNLPLEDKAKYEKSLEQKVDEVLLRVLGPNQAKVVINALMDFTRFEKVDMNSGTADGAADKNALFRWQNISGETKAGPQLLPGFPVASSLNPLSMESQSYQKQLSFPSTFIKKLDVTVLLNRNVSDSESENIKNIVSDLLGVDPKRGDELIIVRAPFAPIWKTVWYTPEAAGIVLKYGILAVMSIIALVVVAVGFLKLAGAMNTMAKVQQSHQISMEFGKGGAPGGQELGMTAVAELEGGERLALPGRNSESSAGREPDEEERTVFNVRLDQVDFLIPMLAKEEPANVALVASHLNPDVRNEFLKRLPAEMSSEILMQMGKVRFVEPDVITTIKEELEKRLQGAVGGVVKVLEVLEQVSLRAKREILERLQQKNPELARQVRAKIMLVEDLAKLPDREMSILASAVKMEDLTDAIWHLPDDLKAKIKAQLADKAWQAIEQTMKFTHPPEDKIEKAVENLLAVAMGLIREGRISNPLLHHTVELLPEPKPVPPPPPQAQAAQAK